MSGVGITYLWVSKEFPPFIRLEGKRGDYEVYTLERTCRNTQSDFDFMCSECGKCVDNGRIIGFNYCPNCGRRVIDDRQGD